MTKKEMVSFLLDYLIMENPQFKAIDVPDDLPGQETLLRAVWKGDISRLQVDAIVNTANRQMLGCFQPLHECTDNTIHTYAGVQLRLECYNLMKDQGHDEPEGSAKITPGYNLPAKFILHTVGPAINEHLTESDADLLAQSYLSCLTLAEKNQLESVALSSLATNHDKHFINEDAARIAVNTVKAFLDQSQSVKKIIFNVDQDDEAAIYHELLH